jgi:oligoribonuclease
MTASTLGRLGVGRACCGGRPVGTAGVYGARSFTPARVAVQVSDRRDAHGGRVELPLVASGNERAQDRIVWIDCEMTGLDLGTDALIEVAALVTDSELTVLGDGVDVVIRPPVAALDAMLDVVREMHTVSGLLGALDSGLTLDEAEDAVLTYVRSWVPEPRRAPLAGNSVATDRGFLARDMAALEAHLHYRIIDVSSIKELSRRWYPRTYFASPAKTGGHRALADIRESIEELKYYREAVFVPQPGPDTETARKIAARHVVNVPTTPA